MMRKRHLHRTRITAASGAPEVETVWCGALNGLCVMSVPLHALLALCTFVTFIRSFIVSGGKIQGIRREHGLSGTGWTAHDHMRSVCNGSQAAPVS